MKLTLKIMLLLFCCVNFPAMAEQIPLKTDKASEEKAADTAAVEDMVVTAQKTMADALDTPASLTVITQTQLEDFNIQSVSDIADFTPNFYNFDTGIMGLFTPSIRGKNGESSGSSVGLYVDGVPILTGTGFNDDLLDIERVEVLRGPQGTFYGKNAQVGAVNIISKKPGNTFEGKVSGQAGTDSKYRLSGTISGPIVKDKFFISLSGLHYEKDGALTYSATGNDVDYREYNYGKVNLRFTPNPDMEASFIVSGMAHDDGSINMNITDYYASLYGMDAPADRVLDSDLEGWNKSNSNMQALQLSWDISPQWRVESVSTRRMYNSHYLGDWDFTAMALFHKEMDREYLTYSQEIRGIYTGEKFKLLAGVYGDDSEQDFVEIDDTTRQVSEASLTQTQSLGVFLNADLSVTEKIVLSSGVRYDRDKGDFSDDLRAVYLDDTWEEISPRMAVTYKPASDISTYASVSKGYLAGGFNDHATDDGPISFDQETLWSYETGVKARLMNDRLFLDFALFYMDVDDYQVRIDVDAEHNYTTNAANVVSKGAELAARFRATPALCFHTSLGYVDATFERYSDTGGDYEGNTVPYSPKYSYTLGAVYRHAKGYYLEADLVGYGKMYLNKENNYPRDPYCIVNAKVGYEAESFDIYLYAENLFDKDYSVDGYYGGLYTVYSPPLEAGLKVTWRF